VDDRALTIWICEQLGILDGWEWSEDVEAEYAASSVGVSYGRIAATPDRGVGVRIYGGTDNHVDGTKTRRVQIRARGARDDPAGADTIADAAFDHLHLLLREGVISEVNRTSISPSGSDGNQREERTDNYLIIFDNPEASS
jgi:hypothetical protein